MTETTHVVGDIEITRHDGNFTPGVYVVIKDRLSGVEISMYKDEALGVADHIKELFVEKSAGIVPEPTHDELHSNGIHDSWVCNCRCPKCFNTEGTYFCVCKLCTCTDNK